MQLAWFMLPASPEVRTQSYDQADKSDFPFRVRHSSVVARFERATGCGRARPGQAVCPDSGFCRALYLLRPRNLCCRYAPRQQCNPGHQPGRQRNPVSYSRHQACTTAGGPGDSPCCTTFATGCAFRSSGCRCQQTGESRCHSEQLSGQDHRTEGTRAKPIFDNPGQRSTVAAGREQALPHANWAGCSYLPRSVQRLLAYVCRWNQRLYPGRAHQVTHALHPHQMRARLL